MFPGVRSPIIIRACLITLPDPTGPYRCPTVPYRTLPYPTGLPTVALPSLPAIYIENALRMCVIPVTLYSTFMQVFNISDHYIHRVYLIGHKIENFFLFIFISIFNLKLSIYTPELYLIVIIY